MIPALVPVTPGMSREVLPVRPLRSGSERLMVLSVAVDRMTAEDGWGLLDTRGGEDRCGRGQVQTDA